MWGQIADAYWRGWRHISSAPWRSFQLSFHTHVKMLCKSYILSKLTTINSTYKGHDGCCGGKLHVRLELYSSKFVSAKIFADHQQLGRRLPSDYQQESSNLPLTSSYTPPHVRRTDCTHASWQYKDHSLSVKVSQYDRRWHALVWDGHRSTVNLLSFSQLSSSELHLRAPSCFCRHQKRMSWNTLTDWAPWTAMGLISTIHIIIIMCVTTWYSSYLSLLRCISAQYNTFWSYSLFTLLVFFNTQPSN